MTEEFVAIRLPKKTSKFSDSLADKFGDDVSRSFHDLIRELRNFPISTSGASASTISISVNTADIEAMILRTLDDDATKNLFEINDSSGSNLLALKANGAINFSSTTPTPAAGDLWFDGSAYNVQPASDTRSISIANGVVISDTTVANTTTETTVYTETVSTDELYKGSKWHTRISGYYSTANASDTFTARLKVGSTTVQSFTSTAENVTNGFWRLEFFFTVRSTGASGTIQASTEGIFNTTSENSANTSTTTVDTTSAENITVTIQWDSADPGDTLTLTQGHTDIFGVQKA